MKKGVFETIQEVFEDGSVLLRNGVRLSAEQAILTLRLSSALTFASVQGLTIQGVVRLDCTNSPHFSLRHLYVGSSRCTAHTLLEVV